jgi:hypothetical protein
LLARKREGQKAITATLAVGLAHTSAAIRGLHQYIGIGNDQGSSLIIFSTSASARERKT